MIWGKETPYDRLGYTVSKQIAPMCKNLFDKFSKDNDDSATTKSCSNRKPKIPWIGKSYY